MAYLDVQEKKSLEWTHTFSIEGQLLDLENDDVWEEEDAEDVVLEGIDVGTWERRTDSR